MLAEVVGVETRSVAVGRMGGPAGGTVHTGVGDAKLSLPQAELNSITVNAPIRI